MTSGHPLKSNCTRSARRASRRGLTILETLLAVGILGLLMAAGTTALIQGQRDRATEIAGSQLETLRQAAQAYIETHAGAFQDPAGPLYLAPGETRAVTPNTLAGAGYLAGDPTVMASNHWGQRLEVWVRRRDPQNLLGFPADEQPDPETRFRVDALVVALDGEDPGTAQLGRAARYSGAHTGLGPDGVVYTGPRDQVVGLDGSWLADIEGMRPSGRGGQVRMAGLASTGWGTPAARWLSPVEVAGHPEANQMQTHLDMDGNRLLRPSEVTFSALTDFEGTPARATEGVYDIDFIEISQTNDTGKLRVSKPSCPDGAEPRAYVLPSAMASNTGRPMRAFRVYAKHDGDEHFIIDGDVVETGPGGGALIERKPGWRSYAAVLKRCEYP